MGTDSWKGHVNGILYGIQFDRALDDTVVTRVADGVTGGLYPGDRAETLEALDHALRYPGPLNDQTERTTARRASALSSASSRQP